MLRRGKIGVVGTHEVHNTEQWGVISECLDKEGTHTPANIVARTNVEPVVIGSMI